MGFYASHHADTGLQSYLAENKSQSHVSVLKP
jgi:hypothetical protein